VGKFPGGGGDFPGKRKLPSFYVVEFGAANYQLLVVGVVLLLLLGGHYVGDGERVGEVHRSVARGRDGVVVSQSGAARRQHVDVNVVMVVGAAMLVGRHHHHLAH